MEASAIFRAFCFDVLVIMETGKLAVESEERGMLDAGR